MPYVIGVRQDGVARIQSQCNTLLIFGSKAETYLAAIGSERTECVVRRVFPDLGPAIEAASKECL